MWLKGKRTSWRPGNGHRGFSWPSSVFRHTPRQEQDTDAWFHNPSNSLFTNRPIIQRCIILATESVV